MIANIRKRIIGAEILGITLSTQATRLRLGIPGFSLTGMSQRYYHVCGSGEQDTTVQMYGHAGRLKSLLKRVPGLWNLLRGIRYSKPVVELAHVLSAARIVRKLDVMIICGGGALDDLWGGAWGHPWTLFKWGVLSRANRVPFLFVSVGKSPLKLHLSRFFIETALRLSQYRSYRDPESKQDVKTLLDNSQDPVYPDLAFSYPLSARSASIDFELEGGRQLTIGVSPIAYCDPRVWPHRDQRRYTAYVNKMTELVRWLLAEGYKVLFFATDTPDSKTIEDILVMLTDSGVSCSEIETLPGPTEQSAGDLLRGICRADLILASRLHGVILSHLNGTPVLAISFEPKVDAHMKRIGQTDYCLDIDNFTLADLTCTFQMLEEHRQEERTHIRSEHLRFRQLLDLQYDKIFGPPHDPED
jgi:polysaccharide pyruvyl transferase WcaK-like protein